MSDVGDQGLWAAIGGGIVGAGAAIAEVLRRKKRPTPAPLPDADDWATTTLAGRVGRLYDRLTLVEQELKMLKQDVATKLDKLEESVDELLRARTRTDELLPIIRDRLKELSEDLRDERRAHRTTTKE